jgi:hypothetical protein
MQKGERCSHRSKPLKQEVVDCIVAQVQSLEAMEVVEQVAKGRDLGESNEERCGFQGLWNQCLQVPLGLI